MDSCSKQYILFRKTKINSFQLFLSTYEQLTHPWKTGARLTQPVNEVIYMEAPTPRIQASEQYKIAWT
jgi:hypothetical protein